MENKLLEEINRYREIIGLNPIVEQSRNSRARNWNGGIEIPTAEVAINAINENIMNLSQQIQNEVFKTIPVKLILNNESLTREGVPKPKSIRLTDPKTGDSYDLPILVPLGGRPIKFNSNVPLSSYLDEVLNTSETDQLLEWYNKNPHIKNEVDNTTIAVQLRFGDNAKINAYGPSGINRKSKKIYNNIINGDETNFYVFFTGSGDIFFNLKEIFDKFNPNLGPGGYAISSNELMVEIPAIIKPPARPDSGGQRRTEVLPPKTIKLDLVDVFKYDTTDIKDQGKYNEAIKKFSDDLKLGLQTVRGYKNFLNGKTLTVFGYASQDNDPSEKVSGKFSSCKDHGDGTRSDYNMCLSDYRAKKVAEDVQKVFDDTGLKVTIQGVGKGETTQFGKGDGWKDKKTDDETDLSPNRRITFNIPRYTG